MTVRPLQILGPQHAPTFIVGTQRSGTTLLAALLDRHSSVAVTPETHFVDLLAYRGTLNSSRKWSSHRSMVEDVFSANARLRDLDLNLGAVADEFATYPLEPRYLFLVLLRQFRQKQGKTLVIEKTPRHFLFLRVIWGWYPEAKVICIVRDGRAVVNSLRRVAFGHGPFWEHAAEWMYQSSLARDYLRTHPEKFRCVRYEDLVLTPLKTLQDICAFIGVDVQARQLDPSIETRVVPDWEMEWKGRVLGNLDPERISAWKEQTTPAERRLMLAIMEQGLRAWGYPIYTEENARLPLTDRVRSTLFRGMPYRLIRLRAVLRHHLRHRLPRSLRPRQ